MKKKLRKWNRFGWGVAIVGLGIYEIYSLVNSTPDDTLSEAIWEDVPKRPYIPFVAGFLCGHLFWQREREYSDETDMKEFP